MELNGTTCSGGGPAEKCRVLVQLDGLSEIATVGSPSTLAHGQFVDALKAALKRVVLPPTALANLWVIDKDFPDVPVLLTDWATFFAENGAPPAVRITVRMQSSSSAVDQAGVAPRATKRSAAAPSNQAASMVRLSTSLGGPFWPSSVPHAGSTQTAALGDDSDDVGPMHRASTMLGDFNDHSKPSSVPRGLAPNSVPWASSMPRRDSGRQTPLRIFLVRHGESETNVDRNIYDTTPDHAVALTERGRRMAEESGRYLRNFLKRTFGSKRDVDHHIRMFVSPFRRTRETAEGLIRSLNDCNEQWVDSVRESTLLAEQDLGAKEGNGRLATEKYREEFERIDIKLKHGGRFWCRMPNGESAFDVCHRISAFFPDVLLAANVETTERLPVKTVIIVSHGITIRAFLTNWCRYSPEWFNRSVNPPNCSVQFIEDQHDLGYMFGGWNLDTPIERPLDVVPLARNPDPQHARWSMFLNQAASADRRDLDHAHAPSVPTAEAHDDDDGPQVQ